MDENNIKKEWISIIFNRLEFKGNFVKYDLKHEVKENKIDHEKKSSISVEIKMFQVKHIVYKTLNGVNFLIRILYFQQKNSLAYEISKKGGEFDDNPMIQQYQEIILKDFNVNLDLMVQFMSQALEISNYEPYLNTYMATQIGVRVLGFIQDESGNKTKGMHLVHVNFDVLVKLLAKKYEKQMKSAILIQNNYRIYLAKKFLIAKQKQVKPRSFIGMMILRINQSLLKMVISYDKESRFYVLKIKNLSNDEENVQIYNYTVKEKSAVITRSNSKFTRRPSRESSIRDSNRRLSVQTSISQPSVQTQNKSINYLQEFDKIFQKLEFKEINGKIMVNCLHYDLVQLKTTIRKKIIKQQKVQSKKLDFMICVNYLQSKIRSFLKIQEYNLLKWENNKKKFNIYQVNQNYKGIYYKLIFKLDVNQQEISFKIFNHNINKFYPDVYTFKISDISKEVAKNLMINQGKRFKYFKQLIVDIVKLFIETLSVEFMFDIVKVRNSIVHNIMIQAKDKKLEQIVTKPQTIYDIVQFIVKIQRAFRRIKIRENNEIYTLALIRKKNQEQQMGKVVYRTQINNNKTYWQLKVFQKSQFLNFLAVDDNNKKIKVKTTYEMTNQELKKDVLTVVQNLIKNIVITKKLLYFEFEKNFQEIKAMPVVDQEHIKIQKLKKKVIFQKTERIDNLPVCFNVTYSQNEYVDEQTVQKIESQPEFDENLQDQNPKNEQNIVQIDIDIDQMLKFNPQLEIKNSDDLNQISSNLVNLIKLDEDYNLKFNSSQINPYGFTMKQSIEPKQLKQQQIQDQDQETQNVKKFILKRVKHFENKKYLIIANRIEVPISNFDKNKVNEDIYENYEVIMELDVKLLGTKDSLCFWQLSQQDLFKISYCQNFQDAANYIISRLLITGNKMVILQIKNKFNSFKIFVSPQYTNQKQLNDVLFLNEQIIYKIQRKFRQKKFQQVFNRYRKESEHYEEITIFKTAYEDLTLNKIFILILIKLTSNLKFIFFDLTDYSKLDYTIDLEPFKYLVDNFEGKQVMKSVMPDYILLKYQKEGEQKIIKCIFEQQSCLQALQIAYKKLKKSILAQKLNK